MTMLNRNSAAPPASAAGLRPARAAQPAPCAIACLLTCAAARRAAATAATAAGDDHAGVPRRRPVARSSKPSATITGKTFIVDPRVRAQVTILSSTPMSPDAFYQAFLSILQVHGFVAVPRGNVIKIIPDANARQLPANDLPGTVSPTRTNSSRR